MLNALTKPLPTNLDLWVHGPATPAVRNSSSGEIVISSSDHPRDPSIKCECASISRALHPDHLWTIQLCVVRGWGARAAWRTV